MTSITTTFCLPIDKSATLTHMGDQVGIRALQQNASEVVKRAAAGEVIEITERGRLVARIVPAGAGGFADLCAAGLIRPADPTVGKLPAPKRVAKGQPTASEVLDLLRESER